MQFFDGFRFPYTLHSLYQLNLHFPFRVQFNQLGINKDYADKITGEKNKKRLKQIKRKKYLKRVLFQLYLQRAGN